jgi:uncharacterized protein YjiS (DUF1127 family)
MTIHYEDRALERRGRKDGWWAGILRRWRWMIETRRGLRLLSAADDTMLKDIGISRCDVDRLVSHGRIPKKSGEET